MSPGAWCHGILRGHRTQGHGAAQVQVPCSLWTKGTASEEVAAPLWHLQPLRGAVLLSPW